MVIEFQHCETLAILAKKGISLETLFIEADAMREIKFLKGEDIWVVKLGNVCLLFRLSLGMDNIFN